MELDVQKSRSHCDIFSLHFARKFESHKTEFNDIHERNIKGEIAPGDLRNALPPSLMKHSQSAHRLHEYIHSKQQSELAEGDSTDKITYPRDTLVVNKDGMTLMERFLKHKKASRPWKENHSTSISEKKKNHDKGIH